MISGGAKWAAFVEQEVKAEHDRRATLDARGQSVVTTSGTLVTLLVAVGALASRRDTYRLPDAALYPLIATLTMFAVAALLGILATFNFAYKVAAGETLTAILNHLGDSESAASKNITFANIITVRSLRAGNNKKALLLLLALFAQLAALIFLTISIYVIVLES